MKKILIVGAGGQIGSELVTYLRGIYGGQAGAREAIDIVR